MDIIMPRQTLEELLGTYGPGPIEWTEMVNDQAGTVRVIIIRYYDGCRLEDHYVRRNHAHARFHRVK